MSRDFRLYIVDIFIAINKINRYTHEITDAQSLRWNEILWDATIRELEIIGESTRVLIESDFLNNKKYRKIVDFRNIIAHGYFGLDEDEVFYVVTNKLLPFETELIQLILQNNLDIKEAILLAMQENEKIKSLTDYLENLQKELKYAR